MRSHQKIRLLSLPHLDVCWYCLNGIDAQKKMGSQKVFHIFFPCILHVKTKQNKVCEYLETKIFSRDINIFPWINRISRATSNINWAIYLEPMDGLLWLMHESKEVKTPFSHFGWVCLCCCKQLKYEEVSLDYMINYKMLKIADNENLEHLNQFRKGVRYFLYFYIILCQLNCRILLLARSPEVTNGQRRSQNPCKHLRWKLLQQ